jgi:hypothetical protein
MTGIFLKQITQARKNIKLGRIRTDQRVFSTEVPAAPDPDSLMMNRIINNLRKEWRGRK